MQLSKDVTDFYLSRLRLFYNPAQIAELLGRSRPSVDRWLGGYTTPRAADIAVLEEGLTFCLEQLINKGFPEVAAALDVDRPAIQKKKYWAAERVQLWLVGQLDKKPVRYSSLLAKGEKVGITRSQLHYASKVKGVTKKSKGYGPHKDSMWSLK